MFRLFTRSKYGADLLAERLRNTKYFKYGGQVVYDAVVSVSGWEVVVSSKMLGITWDYHGHQILPVPNIKSVYEVLVSVNKGESE